MNSLLNSFYKRAKLERRITDYVKKGGRDAFAFSIKYRKDYGNIPGKVIQRMIDEKVDEEINRKGRR